ncbi:LOW QUALITY PROTEIN: cell division cycle-associated protein 2 [Hyperolius riggenbachi]|uniref:LOW QUALITY PROTEIN: cell division cycle-associated protein 2 n=1 Tax=Hyperolius riggenbachi TaxID=752182 RepID=UPI0035A26EF4
MSHVYSAIQRAQVMAVRNVLQEIPIPPPEAEEESFVIVTDEESPLCYNKEISSATAHSKYISNDESKENITPAAFDNINQEKQQNEITAPEKADVTKPIDAKEPLNPDNPETGGMTVGDEIPKQENNCSDGCTEEPPLDVSKRIDAVEPPKLDNPETGGMTVGDENLVNPKQENDWSIEETVTPLDVRKPINTVEPLNQYNTETGGKTVEGESLVIPKQEHDCSDSCMEETVTPLDVSKTIDPVEPFNLDNQQTGVMTEGTENMVTFEQKNDCFNCSVEEPVTLLNFKKPIDVTEPLKLDNQETGGMPVGNENLLITKQENDCSDWSIEETVASMDVSKPTDATEPLNLDNKETIGETVGAENLVIPTPLDVSKPIDPVDPLNLDNPETIGMTVGAENLVIPKEEHGCSDSCTEETVTLVDVSKPIDATEPLNLDNPETGGMTVGAENLVISKQENDCSDWSIEETVTPVDVSKPIDATEPLNVDNQETGGMTVGHDNLVIPKQENYCSDWSIEETVTPVDVSKPIDATEPLNLDNRDTGGKTVGDENLVIPKQEHDCSDSCTEETVTLLDVSKPIDPVEPLNLASQDTGGKTVEDENFVNLQQEDDCSDMSIDETVSPLDRHIGESVTPVDFSRVTIDDWGISKESFIKCAGPAKSSRSLHKFRHRAIVGVRGPPGRNFVARKTVLQRSKNRSQPKPWATPLTPSLNSVVREEMSACHNAFQAVEETEGKLPLPGSSKEEEKMPNTLDGSGHEVVEPPQKRPRVNDDLPQVSSEAPQAPAPPLPVQPQENTQREDPLLQLFESDCTSASGLDISKSGDQVMAVRKALQEIPILPPGTEQQSFVSVKDEATPLFFHKKTSSAKVHSKYISTEESKENVTPAALDNTYKETCQCEMTATEKSDVSKQTDAAGPLTLENSETAVMTVEAENVATPKRDTDITDWSIEETLSPLNWRGGESVTPVDFSKVTIDDLGISKESFTTKCAGKGKSPRSLHKYRRRSTIGVRGSPEMNFLIRQIALQRSKNGSQPEPRTTPFSSPRNSILRQKISAFRNAFQTVEETEGKLQFPGFSEEVEEKASDPRSSKIDGNKYEVVEPPQKRPRVNDALPQVSSEPLQVPAPPLPAQPQENTQSVQEGPLLENISESDGSLASKLLTVSKSLEAQSEEIQPGPAPRKRRVMFAVSEEPSCYSQPQTSDSNASINSLLRPALRKTLKKERGGSMDESEDEVHVNFSLPEEEDIEEEENTLFKKPVIDSVKKKKRVTFGRDLSPELFDKTLPANTPLRKGSTPYNLGNTNTTTPTQWENAGQSPCQPTSEPDPDCRDEEVTFQPLSLCFDAEVSPTASASSDNPDQAVPIKEWEDLAQEVDPSAEDKPLLIPFDSPKDTSASLLDTDIANEAFIAPEPDTMPAYKTETRASNSRKRCSPKNPPADEHSQAAETTNVQEPAKAKRGRKPVVSKKAQVKAPRGKGKRPRGRPRKSVQANQHGNREIVSKKPLLSPIPELPETPSICAADSSSHGKPLTKRLAKKRVPKTKVVKKISKELQLNSENAAVLDSLHPIVNATEDVEIKNTCSLGDGQTRGNDLVPPDVTRGECLEPWCDKEIKEEQTLEHNAVQNVTVTHPEDKDTIEETSPVKPQSRAKRRSYTRRRVSQTTAVLAHTETGETPADIIKGSDNTDLSNTAEVTDKAPKPEADMLSVNNSVVSPKLAVTVSTAGRKRGRRSSRIICSTVTSYPVPEPNLLAENPSAPLSNLDNHSTCELLPSIDDILQSAQTEKKVRRSTRLRRDSDVSGLTWVQDNSGSEKTSRRKSFSSAVRLVENQEFKLENVTNSPNKENLSAEHVSNAAKKTRRRTMDSSTSLKETASLSGMKRRRSNASHEDFIHHLEVKSDTVTPLDL